MTSAIDGFETRYSHVRGVSPLLQYFGLAQMGSSGPALVNPSPEAWLGLEKDVTALPSTSPMLTAPNWSMAACRSPYAPRSYFPPENGASRSSEAIMQLPTLENTCGFRPSASPLA